MFLFQSFRCIALIAVTLFAARDLFLAFSSVASQRSSWARLKIDHVSSLRSRSQTSVTHIRAVKNAENKIAERRGWLGANHSHANDFLALRAAESPMWYLFSPLLLLPRDV